MPVPLFPNAMPLPSAPMIGGVVKTRLIEIVRQTCSGGAAGQELIFRAGTSERCAVSLMPKTFVALVRAIVSALPG